MKKEYDFTNAEQGKFYRPVEKLNIPVYLDDEVKQFFMKNIKQNNLSLSDIVNALIKQDIAISKQLVK